MTASVSPEIVAAAVAGTLSFLSPCMIPVVPAFLARISGVGQDEFPSRRRLFTHALLFVVGFGLVFATLGVALESVLSTATTAIRDWLARIAGVLIIGFGLHLSGLVEVRGFQRGATLPAIDRAPGYLTTLLLGGAFAATWTPCVGPILGSTYALAATQPVAAFPVFIAYSFGLGLPFLLIALVPQRAQTIVSGAGRLSAPLHRASGVVLIALGVLVVTQRIDLLGTAVYSQEIPHMIRVQHPIALAVTLVVIIGAVVYLNPALFGLAGVGSSDAPAATDSSAFAPTTTSGVDVTDENGSLRAERLYDETPDRIEQKRESYPRAPELQEPTDFINTNSTSLSQHLGEKVILVEFWTFGCYNCQNTHPYIQDYWRTYRDDGLVVIGVHYPEFDYEAEPSNIKEYVAETNTTYPIVVDNEGESWDAYDQRYWPTRYLIGVDGFVRYDHIGEGGYNETEQQIQALLAERDRVQQQRNATTASAN